MSLALSAGRRSHGAWAETIHAEWTKLRTLASTGWLHVEREPRGRVSRSPGHLRGADGTDHRLHAER